MILVRESIEVFWARGGIASLGAGDIESLKDALRASPRGRVRINLHPNCEDRLHEMFIAIRADSYIRPHKHETKSEAFHVVYGAVDIVVMNEAGQITTVLPLAADGKAGAFYYRMSVPEFHTLIVKSEILIVHEITNGPFRAGETILASFSPDESDVEAATKYMTELKARASGFCEQIL